MKRKNSIFILIFVILCFGITSANAEQQSYSSWFFSFERMKEVAPITDKLYQEECGDCHFAYQPGWLPEASWRKLLDAKALENHFEENAELNDSTRIRILEILVNASADKSRYKRSKKIMSSLMNGEVPIRISETPFIKSKHHEVSEDVISKTGKIKSLSNCDKCHQKAKESSFDDDTVYVPGYGYSAW